MFGLSEVRLPSIPLHSTKSSLSLNVLLDFLINMINNCLFSLLRSKLSPTVLVNLPRNKLGVVCLINFLFFFLVKKSTVVVKFTVNVIT